jgi:hypothetical protein
VAATHKLVAPTLALLLGLASCVGYSRGGGDSSNLPGTHPATTELLYVTDRALKAVIAFDGTGRNVAERAFAHVVFDVVTDSRGHVYVMYAADNGTDEVAELSHDLKTVMANYSPGGLGFDLAIDANDNLYVEHLSESGEAIYEYPYGSTGIGTVFPVPAFGLQMTGISVRNGVIYTPIKVNKADYELFSCRLNPSARCSFEYVVDGIDCGFTTTPQDAAFVWFGRPYFIQKLALEKFKRRGRAHLPEGYQPGWAGFCALHNYGHFAWLPITASSGTGSAQAIEVDLTTGNITAHVGSGVLNKPVAAFYGNGFTP